MQAQKNQNPIGLPLVLISPEGIFKYILIKCTTGQKTLLFVRGNDKLQYHADNYDMFAKQLEKLGYTLQKIKGKDNKRYFQAIKGVKSIHCECLGGGRIEHNYKGNKCFIYGYSKSFGRVDHQKAKNLISKELKYPLESIKTSKQGY